MTRGRGAQNRSGGPGSGACIPPLRQAPGRLRSSKDTPLKPNEGCSGPSKIVATLVYSGLR